MQFSVSFQLWTTPSPALFLVGTRLELPSPTRKPLKGQTEKRREEDFLTELIQHHHSRVEVTQWAQEMGEEQRAVLPHTLTGHRNGESLVQADRAADFLPVTPLTKGFRHGSDGETVLCSCYYSSDRTPTLPVLWCFLGDHAGLWLCSGPILSGQALLQDHGMLGWERTTREEARPLAHQPHSADRRQEGECNS